MGFWVGVIGFWTRNEFWWQIGTNYFVVQNDSLFKTIELMTFNIHSSSRTWVKLTSLISKLPHKFLNTSKNPVLGWLARGSSWLDNFFWSCWTWLTIFIILSITTHIWKHLAPLLFDCNERFPHRNSNKLIICSYRIHSEPWCETQMLVSISFQSIQKRFVCGTETRCLSLNNDTLSHLTETVETAMTAPFHRSSLIHFVCIGVAPPRLSTPQPREQSRVHNSNAGKIDQSWSNPFMNNVLSFILSMPVCWFVAFIVNLIVVAQVTIPNLKTTLQAILPCCFFAEMLEADWLCGTV